MTTHKIESAEETALIVGVLPSGGGGEDAAESLDELDLLARTAGANVVGRLTQARDMPHVKTYVGKGKAEEIAESVKAFDVTTVFFDDELSPTQQRNLEAITNCKVLDRTALILDIFAQRAHSAEGKLQVELAQLTYRLPRLRGRGVEMSRLGAGIGTRGPGETKLESDRRRILARIAKLKNELESVGKTRGLQRKRRKRSEVPMVTIVGYTNAGKSTLLNSLTRADALAEDMLFATLDSTTRQLHLPSRNQAVLTDTVGFIRKLPHDLVSAFQSTLDEVREADLLLNVIDSASRERDEQVEAVLRVLAEIGADATPRIDVYNKADLLDDVEIRSIGLRNPAAKTVSAVSGLGMDELRLAIDEELQRIKEQRAG